MHPIASSALYGPLRGKAPSPPQTAAAPSVGVAGSRAFSLPPGAWRRREPARRPGPSGGRDGTGRTPRLPPAGPVLAQPRRDGPMSPGQERAPPPPLPETLSQGQACEGEGGGGAGKRGSSRPFHASQEREAAMAAGPPQPSPSSPSRLNMAAPEIRRGLWAAAAAPFAERASLFGPAAPEEGSAAPSSDGDTPA